MRITGGEFRSRALVAPKGRATRPTSDRVREAMFGRLDAAAAVRGARVLDLYAGTGALGLEALSRGAEHVCFVESDSRALAALRANVQSLGVGARSQVVAGALPAALGRCKDGPFDLVLADPPYALVASGIIDELASRLLAAAKLATEGRWVVEHATRDTPSLFANVTEFSPEAQKTYGDTTLSFFDFCTSGHKSV